MVARGEARLRNLIDSLAAFVAVYSPEGVMLDVNQAALDAGGIARTDAVGVRIDQTPWVAHSAATAAGVLQMVRRAAAGETIRSEIDIRVADGSVRYLDVILGPLRDPSGAVVEVLTSAIDITERRRAQDEVQRRLRQQEAVARLGVLALKTRDLPMLVTTGPTGPRPHMAFRRRRGPVPAERRQHPRGRRPERPDGIAASAGARVLGNDVREPPRPDRARRRAGHAGAVERRPRAPHRLQRRRDRAPPHAGVHRRRRAGGVHEQGGRSVRGRPRHARRARPGPQRRPDAGAVLGPADPHPRAAAPPRHRPRHLGSAAARGAAPPVAEDGGGRPAGRRRGPRLQQPADRHHRLQRPHARAARAATTRTARTSTEIVEAADSRRRPDPAAPGLQPADDDRAGRARPERRRRRHGDDAAPR